MDKEEDLYYDSLDEEEFCSAISVYREGNVDGISRDRSTKDRFSEESVPLYDGEVSKNNVPPPKTTKIKRKNDKKELSTLPEFQSDVLGTEENNSYGLKTKASYFSMYQSRLKPKCEKNPDGIQTDRATRGGETERTLDFTDFSEGFQDVIEYQDCLNDTCCSNCLECGLTKAEDKMKGSKTSLVSEVSGISQFKSVSQINFSPRKGEKGWTPRKFNKIQVVSPIIGSLGPVIDKEKLELLQKKQNYGKSVSERNRIKIMEKKVLQNLRKEIENCRENRKIEMKQSDTKNSNQHPNTPLTI